MNNSIKSNSFHQIFILLFWPFILLSLFLLQGLPYGVWDHGTVFSLEGAINILEIQISNALIGNWFSNEIIFWSLVSLTFYLFDNHYYAFLIFFITVIGIFSCNEILKKLLINKSNVYSSLIALIIISNPILTSRLVAGHLPIYLGINSIFCLIYLLNLNSIFKWLVIVPVIFSIFGSAHNLMMCWMILLFVVLADIVNKKDAFIALSLTFIPSLPILLKIFESTSIKPALTDSGSINDNLSYSSEEINSRINHLKGSSLTIFESLVTPVNQGMNYNYVFPEFSLFSNLFFLLINFLIIYNLLNNLRSLSLQIKFFICFCLSLASFSWSPLFLLISFISKYTPNLLAAISTPTIFLMPLFFSKTVIASIYINNRYINSNYFLSFFSVLVCFFSFPAISSFESNIIPQPLSLAFTKEDFRSDLKFQKSSNIYIIPNAYFFELERNGNYIPWTSREYAKDFINYFNVSMILNNNICNESQFLYFDSLILRDSFLIISKFNFGKSYKTNCHYSIFVYDRLLIYFSNNNSYEITSKNEFFFIVKRI